MKKARRGQVWVTDTGLEVCIRKVSDKITFTHMGSNRGHNLWNKLFYKKFIYKESLGKKKVRKEQYNARSTTENNDIQQGSGIT